MGSIRVCLCMRALALWSSQTRRRIGGASVDARAPACINNYASACGDESSCPPTPPWSRLCMQTRASILANASKATVLACQYPCGHGECDDNMGAT
eukprot:4331516-Pleurochrysis_carterae.AAC.3